MLKGIPSILTPELLKVLMEMGHGDELVIADGNYPNFAYPNKVIRCDGHGITELLDAILGFMPLDTYVDSPVTLMEVLADDPVVPVIWDDYKKIIDQHGNDPDKISHVYKFDFYEKAQKACALVTTSEMALYANMIVKKGVVKQ